jgi:hypothetical protein
MNRKQGQDGLKHAFARWSLLLAGGLLLGACVAPPEMAYPSGQGKRSLISAASRAQASEVAAVEQGPVVLPHDAADIQRLSAALTQLRTQLAEAMAGKRPNMAGNPLVSLSSKSSLVQKPPETLQTTAPKSLSASIGVEPVPDLFRNASANANANPKATPNPVEAVPVPVKGLIQVNPPVRNVVFHLEPSDTTLVGVLWRWTRQMGWQMRLNGTLVDGLRFPAHSVAYADVGVERSSELAAPGQALETALGALLQAHAEYQDQLDFTLILLSDKMEINVQSASKPLPSDRATAAPLTVAQAPVH